MKMKRSQLKKMVEEELQKVVKEYLSEKELPDDKKPAAEPRKVNKKPSTKDAISDNGAREKGVVSTKQPDNIMAKAGKGLDEPPVSPPDASAPAPTTPIEDDPADASLDDEPGEKVDDDGISKQLTGKQVSSITMSRESKMMPGGIEINLKFGKSDSPLKILIGKSGLIKFFYKGSLHNEL